ncbi:MAG: aminotransferase class V-fold PLP-dependent enzyme [Acidobacteria bacterium]|nr:aminotransferase class V-fold PLP-dependent enzyme [Acidobacteriota bacterium]
MTTPRPAYDIEAWRRRIPLLASCIPMNNCSQAPQTDATRAAAERYLDSWNRSGMDWDAWMVASALDLDDKRRRIVVSGMEFPGVAHVWLAQGRRGAQLCQVPVRDDGIEPNAYDSLIDERTALVSACHGWYVNGFLQDVARIAARARAAGALSFVDAYQTLGALPVDVRELGVDFLVAGTLKFLMGVSGIAFLYVRPEIVDSLRPTATGWFGRVEPFAFSQTLDWSPNASRFDAGTPPVLNAYIARAGLELIEEVNPASIRAWHEVLARRMIDGGRARGLVLHGTDDVSHKTATTAFVVPDSHAVEAAMRARGVLPSARGPVIRLAPHFYNTLDDVDRALDTLADVIRAR